MNGDLLFVYGTLRRGFKNHRLLVKIQARWVGKGTVAGELYDLGSFPGAKEADRPGSRLVGEVYQLADPSKDLQVLDRYEGCDPDEPTEGLYSRKKVSVVLDGGGHVEAWIYWLRRSAAVVRSIPSGDYGRR